MPFFSFFLSLQGRSIGSHMNGSSASTANVGSLITNRWVEPSKSSYISSTYRKFISQSVEFHNNGKRHQIAVQKRLNEIGKKSAADQKEQNKINEQLRMMNDAAMQSYAQDISAGADISSRAIARANSKKAVDPMALANYESDEEFGPNVSKRAAALASAAAAEVKDPSLWCEARDEEGNTYYWNVKTNESKWSKPKEGFMSLQEYQSLNEIAVKQQEEHKQKVMKNTIENADEIASKYNREQLKKYKKITEEAKPVEEATTSYAGQYGGQPYGKWQTVESKRESKPVDLELPKQDFTYIAVQASSVDEPPVKKFKEKTITKLEDVSDVPSFFKKRNIRMRNIRRGTDDSNSTQ